jgi:hypothetical protein
MLPGLAFAALLSTLPVSPEARLADLDHRRIEIHLGGRGYGRFLDAPPAFGGSLQLGLGVRLVRGLYLSGEAGLGAHAMPVGAAGQVFLGLRHELRMAPWIRPSFSLGYTHLFDASFHAEADVGCGCGKAGGEPGFSFEGGAGAELASRSGVQAGLGLRVPFRFAPRLSLYVRGDVSYYFDDRPGRLQAGGGLGVQVVF